MNIANPEYSVTGSTFLAIPHQSQNRSEFKHCKIQAINTITLEGVNKRIDAKIDRKTCRLMLYF
jgi:hypothetical protein